MTQTFLNLAQGVTGTLPNANFSGGKVLQTVQHTFNTEQNFNNTSYATSFITGAITPTSSSSKILVHFDSVSANNDSANSYSKLKLYRGGSGIGHEIHIDRIDDNSKVTYRYQPVSMTYLDSPNSSSATTYAVYRFKQGGGLAYLGINGTQSTLTLMEIGA